jgi:GNAT superfamily N-acetyltransferase
MIHPEYRGRGFGKTLVEEALNFLKKEEKKGSPLIKSPWKRQSSYSDDKNQARL